MKSYKVIALVIRRDGEIIPSFLAGTFFQGHKVTTELCRRARDLVKSGMLNRIESYPFSRFKATKKGKKYFSTLCKQ